jgi:hypothetical protein
VVFKLTNVSQCLGSVGETRHHSIWTIQKSTNFVIQTFQGGLLLQNLNKWKGQAFSGQKWLDLTPESLQLMVLT